MLPSSHAPAWHSGVRHQDRPRTGHRRGPRRTDWLPHALERLVLEEAGRRSRIQSMSATPSTSGARNLKTRLCTEANASRRKYQTQASAVRVSRRAFSPNSLVMHRRHNQGRATRHHRRAALRGRIPTRPTRGPCHLVDNDFGIVWRHERNLRHRLEPRPLIRFPPVRQKLDSHHRRHPRGHLHRAKPPTGPHRVPVPPDECPAVDFPRRGAAHWLARRPLFLPETLSPRHAENAKPPRRCTQVGAARQGGKAEGPRSRPRTPEP